jgi:hypothetical protein
LLVPIATLDENVNQEISDDRTSQLTSGLNSSDSKYFQLLGRHPIPIMTIFDGYQPVPGDVITCNAVVNWALQRSPIMLRNVNKIVCEPGVDLPIGEKIKGHISRLKFKGIVDSGSTISKDSTSGMEFCEIREGSDLSSSLMTSLLISEGMKTAESVTSAAKNAKSFYCLASELSVLSEYSRDSVQTGDVVEFWAVKSMNQGVALSPVVTPKVL